MTTIEKISAEDLDILVASCIPASPDLPVTASNLAIDLGVTEGRVRRSVARIKDMYPHLPLTSSATGYRWSNDKDDLRAHATKEVRYVTTRTRRSLLDGLLEPFLENHSSDQIDKARQRIEFILDDLRAVSESVTTEWITE